MDDDDEEDEEDCRCCGIWSIWFTSSSKLLTQNVTNLVVNRRTWRVRTENKTRQRRHTLIFYYGHEHAKNRWKTRENKQKEWKKGLFNRINYSKPDNKKNKEENQRIKQKRLAPKLYFSKCKGFFEKQK